MVQYLHFRILEFTGIPIDVIFGSWFSSSYEKHSGATHKESQKLAWNSWGNSVVRQFGKGDTMAEIPWEFYGIDEIWEKWEYNWLVGGFNHLEKY